MGVSSLFLALSTLWIGPFWGQDRLGTKPIVPARVSALELTHTHTPRVTTIPYICPYPTDIVVSV